MIYVLDACAMLAYLRNEAGGGISIPDCFAIILSKQVGGTVLTSDHKEFDPVAAAGICSIIFIR